MELEQTTTKSNFMIEPRTFVFRLQICVDKTRLKDMKRVSRIRFFATYGDTLIRDWREDIRQCFGNEFMSQPSYVSISIGRFANVSLAQYINMPLRISVQTYDRDKEVIESMQEDFMFIKAAASGGTLISARRQDDSRVKVCMIERSLAEESKEEQTHFSYQLEMEYNPLHIPCEDIERVSSLL